MLGEGEGEGEAADAGAEDGDAEGAVGGGWWGHGWRGGAMGLEIRLHCVERWKGSFALYYETCWVLRWFLSRWDDSWLLLWREGALRGLEGGMT